MKTHENYAREGMERMELHVTREVEGRSGHKATSVTARHVSVFLGVTMHVLSLIKQFLMWYVTNIQGLVLFIPHLTQDERPILRPGTMGISRNFYHR
jgi:uncharacterized membrane protein